ncbi:hypothetical protein BUALT_Bualt11G0079600 [Buddleja alternifolia]|uniref:SWIM-type domain-containing protein n=1 Tax=Buddleja alternifolia TaxID=168488 RepID=A0AAV6WY68_9LAMI|nr:hypothetical protein BUALT_Bualt11G0079600 [Buddleja alternifolia]
MMVNFEIFPNAVPGDKHFTLKIHHGGQLLEIPSKVYVGGEVDYIDYCHPDIMSLCVLDKVMSMLGYQGFLAYYYLTPKSDLNTGLRHVLCDQDTIIMAEIGAQHKHRLIELYVVQPSFTGLLEATECDISIVEESGGQGQGQGGLNTDGGVESGLDTNGGVEGDLDTDSGLEANGGLQGGLNSEDLGKGGSGSGKEGLATEGDLSTDEDNNDGDVLYDPDYGLSEDDDVLYEKYVDHDPNNVGSKGKEKMTEPMNWNFFEDIAVSEDGSDIGTSSDELKSLCSDEEDNGETKFIRFNPKVDMHDPQFSNGMVFTNAFEFKEAVRSHAVVWQRDIAFVKNDYKRVRAKCKGRGCHWVALASRMNNSDTFQIRTLNTKHKCGRTLSKNKFVTSRLLSNKYKEDWRLNNGWRVGDFQEKVHNDLNCEISRYQYYRTKKKVNIMLNGDYKDQYARLWDYTEEIKRSNPNSTVVLKTELDMETGEDKFLRLYICLDACRKGFLHGCRPLIGVDGKKTWKWFLELLIEDLGIYEQDKWTFISDRQKGLLPALYELLPDIEHRYCVKHMYDNFKKKHPGLSLKDRMWNVARATTVNQFKSHFRTFPKCDILLNNICESFNAAILEARNKPLLSMVESIRVYLMKRLQSKRNYMSRWKEMVSPKVLKQVDKLKDNTRSCISTHVGAGKFETRDMYTQYSVDLDQHSCTCRRWDLSGIPCVHAISAIMSAGREVEPYINQCYSLESYKKAYGYVINPINGLSEWPITGKGPIAPPCYIKLCGRPKKARRREAGEPPPPSANGTKKLSKKTYQKTVRCKTCGEEGHNKSHCPTPQQNPQAAPIEAQSVEAQPGVQQFVEGQPEAQQSTGVQPEVKKKRKCSVCLQEGHYRSKCPTPTGRMWKNYDRYAFNFHKNIVSGDGSGASSHEGHVALSATAFVAQPHSKPGSKPGVAQPGSQPSFAQPVPPSFSQPESQNAHASANISGVPIKASFVKKGRNCVTLKTLQNAAGSRSFIGELTQQSSSAKETKTGKKKI